MDKNLRTKKKDEKWAWKLEYECFGLGKREGENRSREKGDSKKGGRGWR